MRRRIICFLGAACIMLSLGPVAGAAEPRGSVAVLPECAGIPVSGGMVELRRVGSAVAEGFQLTEGLANWTVKEEEGASRSLLTWLAENARGGTVQKAEGACARFSGLEAGVYLLTQAEAPEGYQGFSPVLVQLPQGDSWEITISPALFREGENPRTGDHPAPIIGAMGIGLSAAVLMVLVEERRK